jgi:hypothetical protein
LKTRPLLLSLKKKRRKILPALRKKKSNNNLMVNKDNPLLHNHKTKPKTHLTR